ncbi:MAG: DUF554 family protein [Verrucomicrobiota bacterium]|jgi:uncharacterized membrane protein YqgA involved in biofilm formation
MLGAVLNAAGIVAGGVCALAIKRPLPNRFQLTAKIVLGIYTVWLGLQLTWKSLNGSVLQILKELCIVLLAMALGKLAGKALRLQELSNSIGQYATRSLAAEERRKRFSDGFLVATSLFCAGPLAILASVQEGLNGFSPVFLVKAGTDGLATMAFCATFGWGALVSAVPVLAFQGCLIRCVQALEPTLQNQPWPLVDSINATDGLLIFSVALIILEVKKVRVTEYLPSLILAPLLVRWLW